MFLETVAANVSITSWDGRPAYGTRALVALDADILVEMFVCGCTGDSFHNNCFENLELFNIMPGPRRNMYCL